MKFNKLDVPQQWKDYFTKYPHGYTIFEALCNWTNQVDNMVVNQNEWNDYLDNFVEQFEFELQAEVKETLIKWQDSGLLDIIIDEALQTQMDVLEDETHTKLEMFETQLSETVSKDSLFVSVKDYGAIGDGVTDDWQSIQNAFNSGFSIRFPSGVYLTGKNLQIPSNVVIDFTGATIKRKPNAEIGYKILNLAQSENVTLISPTLIGESDEHLGVEGQWGHGIDTGSSKNITISNPTISNCFGDGIYIGRNSGSYLPENISIQGVAAINKCRRQGISVVNGTKLFIDTLKVSNIEGSPPGAGLDIEPNGIDEHVELVVNNLIVSNSTYGLLSIIPSERVNVTVHNLNITNCVTPVRIRTDETGESDKHGTIKLGDVVIDGVVNNNPIIIENNFLDYSPKIIIGSVTVTDWVISDVNSNVVWTGVLRFYITRKSLNTNVYGGVSIGAIKVMNFDTNKPINSMMVSTSLTEQNNLIKNVTIGSFESDNIENSTSPSSSVKMEDVMLSPSTPNYYKLMNNSTHIGEGFNFRKYSLSGGTLVVSDTFKFAHLYTNEPFLNLNFLGGSKNKEVIVNGVVRELVDSTLKLSNIKNKIIVFMQHDNKILIDFESKDSGSSTGRPVMTNDDVGGFSYFDKSLNKPIWWNGVNWVDATGTTV